MTAGQNVLEVTQTEKAKVEIKSGNEEFSPMRMEVNLVCHTHKQGAVNV